MAVYLRALALTGAGGTTPIFPAPKPQTLLPTPAGWASIPATAGTHAAYLTRLSIYMPHRYRASPLYFCLLGGPTYLSCPYLQTSVVTEPSSATIVLPIALVGPEILCRRYGEGQTASC